jgi:hypothetical protein
MLKTLNESFDILVSKYLSEGKVLAGWVIIKDTGLKSDVITKRPLADKSEAEKALQKIFDKQYHGYPNSAYHIVEVGPNAPYELLNGNGVAGLNWFVRPRR